MIGKYFILLILVATLFIKCTTDTYPQGKRLYTTYCANCHMEDGTGLGQLIPPLAKSDYLISHRDNLACIVLNGLKGPIIVNGIKYDQVMPPAQYSAVQINNIVNYIGTAWDNKMKPLALPDTEKVLADCQ
ncbi:MAG: cytochrome c [Saprospiraceae bacterium]